MNVQDVGLGITKTATPLFTSWPI